MIKLNRQLKLADYRSKTLVIAGMVLLWLIYLTSPSEAAITKTLNYQGQLKDQYGVLVADSDYNMILRLYDAPTGGNCLWSARGSCETPQARSVATVDGVFSIVLGDTGASDNAISLDFSSQYYLSIQIAPDASEMTPRKPLTAVPQAFNANSLVGDGRIDLASTAAANPALNVTYNPTSGTNSAAIFTYGSAGGTGTALNVTQAGSGLAMRINDDGTLTDSSPFVIDTSGNVGIGTASPGAKLDVVGGSVRTDTSFISTVATGNNALSITAGSKIFMGNDVYILSNSHEDGLDVRNWNDASPNRPKIVAGAFQGTGSMVSYFSGNVGIGTTNPQKKLDVTTVTNDFITFGLQNNTNGQFTGIHFGYKEDANTSYRKSALVFETLGDGAARGKIHILNDGTNDSSSATLADARLTINYDGNVGIGTVSPSSFKLQVAGNIGPNADASYDLGSGSYRFRNIYASGGINQGGYWNTSNDNLVYNSDFEMGTLSGWSGFTDVLSGTANSYAGNYSARGTGNVQIISEDFIPVDPTRDVIQLEVYAKKKVNGTTPGVLYFGYIAYDNDKNAITTAPCGTYCYFAASGATIPNDGAWHKYSSTNSGEGTSYPNFPVGTRFVRVLGLINYSGSGDAETLVDHITLKKINNGPLFVGNDFGSTNMVDQYQASKIYTTSANNLILEPPASGNVGIGTASPGALLNVYGATGIKLSSATNYGLFNLFPGADSTNAGFLTFGDGTGWKFNIGKASDGGATKFVTIQDNGNVGIGTTNPGTKLDVVGGAIRTDSNGYTSNNISGTGTASYHPGGIYSAGTNWLYGTMYLNANTINDIGNAGTDFTSGGGLTLAGTFDPNGAITLPTTGISGAGTGSGLDADLLDGQNSAYYLDNTDNQTLGTSGSTITLTNGGSVTAPYATSAGNASLLSTYTGDQSSSLQYWQLSGNDTLNPSTDWYYGIRMGHGDAGSYYSGTLAFNFFDDGEIYWRRKSGGTNGSWIKMWNADNDGSGGGLDADLLDGQDSSSFMSASADNWVNVTGDTMSGNLNFSNIGAGPVGTYDASRTQAVWSMGSSYVLPIGGGTTNYGSMYGLAWSYNPDYGGAGNNPQSKAGLNHQLLIMNNAVTQTAIGTGIWTSGDLTAIGAGNFGSVYSGEWFRNNASLTGLYNQVNANHVYSENANYWTMTSGGSSTGGLIFRDAHQSTLRGFIYHDTSGFGLLSSAGGWSLRTAPGSNTIYMPGYVGIGAESPQYQLQIAGALGFTAESSYRRAITPTYWGYSTGYRALMIGSTSSTFNADDGAVTVAFNYDPSVNANGSFTGDGREIIFRRGTRFVTPNATNDAWNLTNLVLKDGNVGIGTDDPGAKLEVSGISRFNSGAAFSAINTGFASAHGYATGNWGIRLGATGSAGIIQAAQDSSAYPISMNPYGGNVGIGTAGPSEKLAVAGNIQYLVGDGGLFDLRPVNQYGFGLRLKPNGSAAGDANRNFQIGMWDNNNVYYPLVHVNEAGYVGIGTTAPSDALHVVGDATISDTQGANGAIALTVSQSDNGATNYGIYSTATGAGTTNIGGYFSASGATNNYALITGTGNVGIGTASPAQTLDVGGNVIIGPAAATYLYLRDDESTSGAKSIHANSNVIGFLSGSGSWQAYWDNAGNQQNTGTITAPSYAGAVSGSSFGSIKVAGTTNGYGGIYLSDTSGTVAGMYDTNGNGGDYDSSTGWHTYWLRSQASLGIGGSQTYAGYKAVINGNTYGMGTGYFTDTVTAPTFSGALSGNATTATTATNALGLSNDGNAWTGMGQSSSAGGATAVGGYYPYALNVHTGLAFSAHSSYGGIRFYNQPYPTAPMSATAVMDIINGNVGIGTEAPGAKLDVRGQVIGGFGAMSTSGTLDWNDVSNARAGNGYSLLLGNATNGPVAIAQYFHPLSFEYSAKDGTGNMTQLAIPYYTLSGNGADALWIRSRYSGTWSSWRQILTENGNGNVGIGTVSPDAPLHAKGGAAMTGGWNRTATLEATFPSLVFNSNNTKWGGILYDYSSNMVFKVGATSNDIMASGVSALALDATSGAATFASSLTVTGTFDPNGAITFPTTGISGAGSGSGLNADLLDGVEPGNLSVNYANYSAYQSATGTSNDWVTSFQNTPPHTTSFREMSANGPAGTWWFMQNMRHSNSSNYWGTQLAWGWEDNASQLYQRNISSNNWGGWVKYWNSENDISGSGLNADLLDGADSSAYRWYDGWVNSPGYDANTIGGSKSGFTYANNAPYAGPLVHFDTGGYGLQFNANYGSGGEYLSFRTRNGDNSTWNGWNSIWTSENDGNGSGMESDYSYKLHRRDDSSNYSVQTYWTGSYWRLYGYDPSNNAHADTHVGYADNAGYAASAGNADTTDGMHMNSNSQPTFGALNFYGVGSDSGIGACSYCIHQEAGAWSSPYPDLAISYHTGIKIGAHSSYGGTRFYNNSDMATEIFSVGSGDNNVRVANNFYVSGDIGIGTSYPYAKLSVVGTPSTGLFVDVGYGSGQGIYSVSSSNYGIHGYSQTGTAGYFESPSGYGLVVASGNVGIGTTAPGAKLSVNGAILLSGAGNIILSGNWISGDGGDEGMYVKADGNIGIGTAAPYQKLEVNGAIAVTGPGQNVVAQGPSLQLGYESGDVGVVQVADWEWSSNYMPLALNPKGGNVGIGTTVPTNGKLHVAGTSYLDGTVTTTGLLTASGDIQAAIIQSNAAITMQLDKDGGGTNSFKILDDAGATAWQVAESGNVNMAGSLAGVTSLTTSGRISMGNWVTDGDAVAYRDTATDSIALASSDVRLKKNLEPLTGALDLVTQLDGYLYNELDETDGDKKRLGIMAQDIMPLMPELTFSFSREGSSETYYSVHYDKLPVLLLEAIKEQQAQINDLATLTTALTVQGGNVGIGTSHPQEKLTVNGNIYVDNGAVIVDGTTLSVPDYVFEADYRRRSLEQLESYISANAHLPGVASRAEIRQQGMNYGEMMLSILEKTEENTLYIIDNHKNDLDQETKISAVQYSISNVQAALDQSLSEMNIQTLTLEEQLALNSQDLKQNQALLSQVRTDQAELAEEVKQTTSLTSKLAAEMALLKTQNQAVIDFALAIDPGKLLYRDSAGNLEISGHIKAQDIEALGVISAKEIETEALKLEGGNTSGQATIKAGETEITIETPAASENAKIYVTAKGSTHGKTLYFDDVVEGQSFKVKIDAPALEKDIQFNWLIIK